MNLCCLWPPWEGDSGGVTSEACAEEGLREGRDCTVWCVSHCWCACAVSVGSMPGCSNIGKAIKGDFKAIRKPRAIRSRCLFLVVWKGLLLGQRPEVSEHGNECSQIASRHFKEFELFLSSTETLKIKINKKKSAKTTKNQVYISTLQFHPLYL